MVRSTPLLLLGILLVSALPLSAQRGTAVVIGISDYQDAAIADLRFAHNDAEAFADYLAETELETRVLTNDQATRAAITSALNWQRQQTAPGDLAILYFAGHGDAEVSAADDARGYLLAYDTPPHNYPLTAIDLPTLDGHLAALTGAGSEALLISDACHAGSLAGNAVSGRQLTATQLLRQHTDQVRILSCLPDEVALEGEQWGGGRGAFSYYFVEALRGRADEDRNDRVDLFELEAFVRRYVRDATDQRQLPTVEGDQRADLRLPVVPDDDARQVRARAEDLQRDFIAGTVALAPTESQRTYTRFERARARGDLLEPVERSALTYYEQLRQDPALLPIAGLLTERFTVSLLDSVQQALVAYLAADPGELDLRRNDGLDRYTRFIAYLRTAASLVGPTDPRNRAIQTQLHYFRSVQLRLRGDRLFTTAADSTYRLGLAAARAALDLNREPAYIWNELGLLHLRLKDFPAAEEAFREAIRRAPTWALPYNNLGSELRRADARKNFTVARANYLTAIRYKPNFKSALNNLGVLYATRSETLDSAEYYLSRVLALDPEHERAKSNLAYAFMKDTARIDDAIQLMRELIAGNDSVPKYYLRLSYAHIQREEYAEAFAAVRSAVELDHQYENAYTNLYLIIRKAENARGAITEFLNREIGKHPANAYPYAGLILLDTTSAAWAERLSTTEIDYDQKVSTFIDLGYLLNYLDVPGMAERSFLAATQLDDTVAEPYAYLTEFLQFHGRRKAAATAARSLLHLATAAEVGDYCSLFREGGPYTDLLADRRVQATFKKRCDE